MRPRVRYSLFFLDLLVVSLLPLHAEPKFSSVVQAPRTAIPDLTRTDPRRNIPAWGRDLLWTGGGLQFPVSSLRKRIRSTRDIHPIRLGPRASFATLHEHRSLQGVHSQTIGPGGRYLPPQAGRKEPLPEIPRLAAS